MVGGDPRADTPRHASSYPSFTNGSAEGRPATHMDNAHTSFSPPGGAPSSRFPFSFPRARCPVLLV